MVIFAQTGSKILVTGNGNLTLHSSLIKCNKTINSDLKITKGTDLFSQLYIVSIIVPDGDSNYVFPIVFGLLKRKTKQTYIRFLTWIKYQYRHVMSFQENEMWLESL